MSGKTEKKIRRTFRKNYQNISDSLVRELLDAPLRFRLAFAMKIIFRRKSK